ncbi:MAG: branched-chain amino acid aminotransferase [Alphaproteobacteria bacterium]|jgi:branched-chain amino acid aminotransferase|nr:branched-chain amino acid aminotransferase [Alphaproteobacteria bacterium]
MLLNTMRDEHASQPGSTIVPFKAGGFSKTWTFFDGDWHDGNAPIMGARSHATWLGSMVFDGARTFEGVTPDLDLHCARVNNSAKSFLLKPTVAVEDWIALANDGIRRFDRNAELYIRPMYWAETGSLGGVRHDPESTRWCLCIYEAPLPKPTGGAITLSPFRRPTMECAPVDAKAGCLYPNNARALIEAGNRGFDNCLLRDMLGNVAELGTANVFMAKDGVVYTPAANGTFLNGITRQRIIKLLRDDGVTVIERTMSYAEFQGADEIFSSGNFSKVSPYTRIDDRELQPGPFYRKARELYWAYAHA